MTATIQSARRPLRITGAGALVGLIMMNLPMMYLDGYVTTEMGFTRLQTVYFASLLALALVAICTTSPRIPIWLLCAGTALGITALVSAISWGSAPALTMNAQYLLRGPALFAALTVLLAGRITRTHARRYAAVTIVVIVVSSGLHAALDLGAATKNGRANPLLNGYLSDTNAAVFSLLLAGLILAHLTHSLVIRMLVLAALASALIALDSKAGLALLALYSVTAAYLAVGGIGMGRIFGLGAAATLPMTALMLAPERAVHLFLHSIAAFSVKGQGILAFRLSEWEVLTVLTATRDLKFTELNTAFPLFEGPINFLAGYSFAIYDSQRMVESDAADVLFALGSLGALACAVLYFWPLLRSAKGSKLGVCVLILTASYAVCVGHVLFSPASAVSLAVAVSLVQRTGQVT